MKIPTQINRIFILLLFSILFVNYRRAQGLLDGFMRERGNLEQQFIEAGDSRVYGGIHYQFDNLEGRKSGVAVGKLLISEAQNEGIEH
ncbi:hypothetical protein [Pricia antarctica]|uniref:hypothetical protein n=1 Tax=Pricia antarctica TaxID=641691 RepID=UPI0011138BD0|nr:hypothetical protein [Pricia antarctica]